VLRLINSASAYKVYTTEFDIEMRGDAIVHTMNPAARADWEVQIADYHAGIQKYKSKAGLNGISQLDLLRTQESFDPENTSVSIVIDHSGSLRGQRAIITCFATELVADFLSRAGVCFEILGFTTAQWKGGLSREKWIRHGRPFHPGRLNDLLHIVYREAADSAPGAPHSVYHLLRNELLKENIDGEALFWAAERLKNTGRNKNIVLVLSDGAPVDDSTLAANTPAILWDHLKAVIKDIEETPGFDVAALGIDYDLSKLYKNGVKVDGLEAAAEVIPQFVASVL